MPPCGNIRRGIYMSFETLRHYWDVTCAALAQEKKQGATVSRQRDEMQFLPAALEILETPASPIGRMLMWVLIALFSLALAWSIVGKVEIVAVAQGKLIPNGKSKIIQPLEAGIVKTIWVANGEHVALGQVLIELDPGNAAADVSKFHTARIDALLTLRRAQALLNAQRSNTSPKLDLIDDASSERLRDAQHLADSIFDEYRSKVLALRTELQRRETELHVTHRKIEGLQQTLLIARAEESDYASLHEKNYVSRHEYLEKQQAHIQVKQDLAAQHSYTHQLHDGFAVQRQEIATAIAQFRHEQLDILNQAQEQLAQIQGDERKSQLRQSQMVLLAPVAGTVQQLAVHTVGGVVTPAQQLLVIVPDDAGLEIEAHILNQDIGFVRAKQDVAIKLDAFPYTRYGTLPGKVLSISHDAVMDEKLGLIYQARIALLQSEIAIDGKHVRLSPGMASAIEIKTEQRRIIEYLLSPLLKYQSEALRER